MTRGWTHKQEAIPDDKNMTLPIPNLLKSFRGEFREPNVGLNLDALLAITIRPDGYAALGVK